MEFEKIIILIVFLFLLLIDHFVFQLLILIDLQVHLTFNLLVVMVRKVFANNCDNIDLLLWLPMQIECEFAMLSVVELLSRSRCLICYP